MAQSAGNDKPVKNPKREVPDFTIPDVAPESRAIVRALDAFITVYYDLTHKGCAPDRAFKVAKDAYVLYMPLLVDRKSIHDFIACVSQGILHQVFEPKEANSLLYAAQVALSLQRKSPRKTEKR